MFHAGFQTDGHSKTADLTYHFIVDIKGSPLGHRQNKYAGLVFILLNLKARKPQRFGGRGSNGGERHQTNQEGQDAYHPACSHFR